MDEATDQVSKNLPERIGPRGSTSRRDVLRNVLAGWFTLTALPTIYAVLRYVIPPASAEKDIESFRGAKLSELTPNSSKLVKFNQRPVIMVRTEDDRIRAFSAVCTHLGCTVEYKPEMRNFRCNCHGSVFDMNGTNIAGPAPKPLSPYRVDIRRDDIILYQP